MEEVAPGIVRYSPTPFDSINVYLLDDVLVDAADRFSARRILRAFRDHRIRSHLITHAHPDHRGSSHRICSELGIPFACGAGDQQVAASGDLGGLYPGLRGVLARSVDAIWGGPGHPVDRVLQDGDRVGDFTVVACPGHTPGHIGLWREGDRALILGDVLLSMNPFTLRRGLCEPPRAFTVNPAQNRESARKLAALEPRLVCFGHGPPLRDTKALNDFVARLP